MSINRIESWPRPLGLLLVGLSLLANTHCQSANTDANGRAETATASAEVIVYGRKACPICTRFIRNLEDRSIAYDFRSVNDRNEAAAMWAIVRERFPDQESVGLPVVVLGERAWIRPQWSEFLAYWKMTR